MAIPASSSSQINHFLEQLSNLPPDPEKIAGAQELFTALKANVKDEAFLSALDEAQVILDLKKNQIQTALKVQELTLSIIELQRLLQTAPPDVKKCEELLQTIKTGLDQIPAEDFPSNRPKTALLLPVKHFELFLKSQAGNSPFKAALEKVGLAAFVSAVFGYTASLQGNGVATGAICGFIGALFSFAYLPTSQYLMKKGADALTHLAAPKPVEAPKPEAPPQLPLTVSVLEAFLPNSYPLPPLHHNKKIAYDFLTQGTTPTDPLHLAKIELNQPKDALATPLFQKPAIQVARKNGPFTYPESTPHTMHWTADFADPQLLGYIDGPLLAQEELLALEHPALYHLQTFLTNNPAAQQLGDNQAVLIQNVKRYGSLTGLYGAQFAKAPPEELTAHLTRFETPTSSNLFAIAALPLAEPAGTPYKKSHLSQLFLRSYTAFKTIQLQAGDKRAVVHTGNWGAGAFGGSPLAAALTQLIAARAAGVNVAYYPLAETKSLAKARFILQEIEKQAPHLTVNQLLTYLERHATEFGIVFQEGNNT